MIKYHILFFVLIIFIQIDFAQSPINKFEVFENNELAFKYPNNWRQGKLDMSSIIQFESIVLLESKVFNNGKYKGAMLNSFRVSKKEFIGESLEEFIGELKEKRNLINEKHNLKIERSIFKLKENHYSVISKTSSLNSNKKHEILETHSIIHYRLHNDFLYTLNLTYLPTETEWILNNASLMFDSFSFKN